MFKIQNPIIKIHEPFAKFLGNPQELVDFEISLYDAARLSGHLCPSVAGAFLITKKAIEILYPEDHVCQRGDLEVYLPGRPDEAAFGPIANVISFITGAWNETGFGGLRGEFSRRNLLHFSTTPCIVRNFIFVRRETRATVTIHFDPGPALQRAKTNQRSSSFEESWQANIAAVLNANDLITCV